MKEKRDNDLCLHISTCPFSCFPSLFAGCVLILDISYLCAGGCKIFIRLSKPRVLKRQMSMVFCLIGLMIRLVCPLESSLSALKFTALEGNLTLKAYTTSSLQVVFKYHLCI